MPPHLLTMPRELRLRILEYAVTLKPTIICEETRDHSDDPRAYWKIVRGFKGNPRISLYLICSQITNELTAIGIPALQLEMCDHSCIHDYFRQFPAMHDRVGAIEVGFRDDLFPTSDAERHMRSCLRLSAGRWGFAVSILELKCAEIEGGGAAVDGRAIFQRQSS